MLQAADTIWELRDDLQRANAENARLRDELESVGTAAYLYGCSDLKAENAKLRTFLGGGSIVTDYWKDEDGTMHVLTTDGEHTYEYMRGGLADENAKLREQVGSIVSRSFRTADKMACLEAENAELRELLQYVADNHLCGTWLLDRMRELGVEATE